MGRRVRLVELLAGVEGLALLRGVYEGTDEDADARLDELRRLLADDALAEGEDTREASAAEGYAAWADTYDEPGNLIVALEEPAVRAAVGRAGAGRALDAACGTGRHGRWLAEQGWDVVGVDLSPEMLAHAGGHGLATGVASLAELPCAPGAFDLVVCGLAVAHVADLRPVMAEFARVLRPGGRAVASALHPFQAALAWHAPFTDAAGNRAFVREHAHTHADYLRAFRSAGLEVTDCAEPLLAPEHVEHKRRAFRHVPAATLAAYVGLPGIVVWTATKT